jgi:hypothetical protein
MIPRSPRRCLSAVLALLMTILFLFGAGLVAQASSGSAPRGKLEQGATDYPYPEDFYDYPVDTAEPLLPTEVDLTPGGSPTPLFSPTPPESKFATENAEMQDTIGTQYPSATTGPSITPADTQTAQGTLTTTVVAAAAQDSENFGLKIDWGFFWAGFAVPFLAACGVVLYLLDRRPELFRPRQKPPHI